VPQVVMHDLEMPDDLTRGGPERDDRVGVHVCAEPLATVVVGARTAGGNEEEAACVIDRHHRPHVRRPRAAPAVTGPRGARWIGLVRGNRVPAPAEHAAPRVIRADHASLESRSAIVADGAADNDEAGHDGGWRRHLIAAAVVKDVDALGEIDLSVTAEAG